MGAIRQKDDYIVRGKALDTGKYVIGNYVQMLIDSDEHAYVYPFPSNPNSGNHSYTPQPIDCDPESIQRFTGLTDFDGDEIFEGEIVELPTGQRGEVVFELGAWGIAVTDDMIKWDRLDELVREIYGNEPYFLYNDNFISFWELTWNLCSEDSYDSKCSAAIVVYEGDTDLTDFHEVWRKEERDD